MTESKDGFQERQLSLAVRKAFRQLLKDIESEPTLIVESNSDIDVPGEKVAEIRAFLFKRR